MRVLIYIEPHPVRNTLAHFDDVLRQFLPLLSSHDKLDIRVFANNATYNKVGEGTLAARKDRLIRSTPEEEDLFNRYFALPWSSEGLSAWTDLMAGRGEISDVYLGILRRVWNIFPFEVLVHWGENGAVTRFLDERPVTRVAMELGCTRPPFFDSIVMDTFGTNGAGVVPKLSIEDLRGIVDNRPMSRHVAMFGYSQNLQSKGYSQQFEVLDNDLYARLPRERLVFLPLQLFDDANLVRFSPYDTLSDVVLDVVPKLAAKGYTTLIKPHPASKHRAGSLTANAIAHAVLRPWADRVIWCGDGVTVSNARLFAVSDFVVTVNSSVGFEALYYDKPVVVLGDAVYKPRGLFPTLDQMLSGAFDFDAYLDGIGILRQFMLGGYLLPENIRRDISSFGNILALLDNLYQRYGGNPVALAQAFWRANAPARESFAKSAMLRGISVPGRAEFGVPAITPAPAQKVDQERDAGTRGAEAYLTVIARLRSFWRASMTLEQIESLWSSKVGQADLLTRGDIVDPDYYLAMNPDVAAAGIDPLQHFLSCGLAEGRSPRPNVPATDLDGILSALQEIARSRMSGADAPTEPMSSPFVSLFERLMDELCPDDTVRFLEWLEDSWSDTKARIQLIRAGGFVEPDAYLEMHQDVKDAGVDPVHHYCFAGINEGRAPSRSLPAARLPEVLEYLKQAAVIDLAEPSLPTFPLEEAEESRRQDQLAVLRTALLSSPARVAVVAHLYYTHLVPEILDRLKTISEPFDLIVTMPDWGTRKTRALVEAAFPQAVFYEVANRGRDIGPFIDLLPLLLDKDYEAVLKIQTKRGYFRAGCLIAEYGQIWRHETFDSLLGSPARVAEILDAFRNNPNLTMVGPEPFLLSLKSYPYHDGGALAKALIGTDGAETSFFAGTMFWVRPSSLRALSVLTLPHFAPETGASDGVLSHLVERMFGQAASTNGGQIATAPVDSSAPLNHKPTPAMVTIDAYLTERQKKKRHDGAAARTGGALIW